MGLPFCVFVRVGCIPKECSCSLPLIFQCLDIGVLIINFYVVHSGIIVWFFFSHGKTIFLEFAVFYHLLQRHSLETVHSCYLASSFLSSPWKRNPKPKVHLPPTWCHTLPAWTKACVSTRTPAKSPESFEVWKAETGYDARMNLVSKFNLISFVVVVENGL